jgi:hypothetical protein
MKAISRELIYTRSVKLHTSPVFAVSIPFENYAASELSNA